MSYQSFLPAHLTDAEPAGAHPASGFPAVRDARDGAVYLLDAGLRMAVDVALATGRPLLLRGEPGSGKSSLAAYVARNLGWRYYEHVVTSRTTALDLLWTFDSVRKLADAAGAPNGAGGLRDHDYVEPGVLWWALDRRSAARRGLPPGTPLPGRTLVEPNGDVNASRSPSRAVVLIDEIDKADPDVPNGLLVPLGSSEFRVTEINTVIRSGVADGAAGSGLLVVITTNEERELPPAFLRRCISHTLARPDRARLVAIGGRHVAASPFLAARVGQRLLEQLADAVVDLRGQAVAKALRPPSTAEYLDAVWACASLGVAVGDPQWEAVRSLVLVKDDPAVDL
jgi:MoxR-like ATPase